MYPELWTHDQLVHKLQSYFHALRHAKNIQNGGYMSDDKRVAWRQFYEIERDITNYINQFPYALPEQSSL